MWPFSEDQGGNLKKTLGFVQSVLSGLGLDPDSCQFDTENELSIGWVFNKGSAEIRVELVGADGMNVLRVLAPIMQMPDDGLLPLYRRLLELNHAALVDAAFGLSDDLVVLTSERATTGISREEVAVMIATVAEYADKYDDELVNEFGGIKYADLPA